MGNKALAVSAADFVDALAEYDHLPALRFVQIPDDDGCVKGQMGPAAPRDGIRQVAAWADVFGASVRFTFLKGHQLCDVDTYVEVGGRELRLRYTAFPTDVEAIDFGIDVCHCHHAEVSAARVLKAVAS